MNAAHHPHRPARGRHRVVARLGLAAATAGFAAMTLAVLASPASAAAPTAGSGQGWIRFAHFAVANGPVDVTLDGTTLDADASFETVTPYRAVTAGPHTVVLRDIDAPHTTWTDHVTVAAGGAVTVGAIAGTSTGIRLEEWTDDLTPGPAGDARVRVIDTAPSVMQATVTLERDPTAATATTTAAAATTNAATATGAVSGVATVSDVGTRISVSTPPVAYGASSPYEDVLAGTYTVLVRGPGGRSILTGRDWPVAAGTVASVVVIQAQGKATLEVLRDAAGTGTAPVGGMETGYGGEAAVLDARSGGTRPATDVVVLVALGAAGLVALAVRRRAVPGRRLQVTATLVAAALVVGATACSPSADHTAVAHPAHAAPASPAVPTTPAPHPVVGHGTTVDLSSASAGRAVAPTSLSIPSIGVDTSLVTLGRTADGAAQVPTTTAVAGWYDDGPAPGQPGPSVILGHVDSYLGPGVFFRLHELQPGALIHVDEQGRTLTFEVQAVQTFSKAAFPTTEVFGPTPETALRLVTCGGPFDYTTRHYDDNVVVFSTEV